MFGCPFLQDTLYIQWHTVCMCYILGVAWFFYLHMPDVSPLKQMAIGHVSKSSKILQSHDNFVFVLKKIYDFELKYLQSERRQYSLVSYLQVLTVCCTNCTLLNVAPLSPSSSITPMKPNKIWRNQTKFEVCNLHILWLTSVSAYHIPFILKMPWTSGALIC